MAATFDAQHGWSAPRRNAASLVSVLIRACARLSRVMANRRQAGMLASMDDRMLADIGLTRSDVRDAYAEPLWRDPTDILAGRVRDRRRHRPADIHRFPRHVSAPSLMPDAGKAPWPAVRDAQPRA